jgi:tRNA (mo5U34)-methyltransferase
MSKPKPKLISVPIVSHATEIQRCLDRAAKKTSVNAVKPLRRLLRNQGAVNDSLMEGFYHLFTDNQKMLEAITDLQSRASRIAAQLAPRGAQEPETDAVSSSNFSVSDWQREIDKIEWYHDFDFGYGLRAYSRIESRHVDGARKIWRFIEQQLNHVDFHDKSVLDVGAWDGFWSFFAEGRGARSVMATDDISQNWGKETGLPLARKLLQSNIEVRQDLPIYELGSLKRKFDIILCLGVFYHLRDPFYGFAQLRHCCHPGTIVLIEGEVARNGIAANEARYFSSSWMEFLPGESVLTGLLKLAYLQVESLVWLGSVPTSPSQRANLQTDRAFIICRPFTGRNEMYAYRPHFDLHVYDDRFGT